MPKKNYYKKILEKVLTISSLNSIQKNWNIFILPSGLHPVNDGSSTGNKNVLR